MVYFPEIIYKFNRIKTDAGQYIEYIQVLRKQY